MCGISGYIGNKEFEQGIAAMVASQEHRGPDFSDVFTDTGFAALGHNRLSIIDLSAEANQPFQDAAGRYVMVYNGEVYNYKELKQDLKPHYDFKTQSDTEVVLAAYIHYGAACLEHFNGMFAFAIWDTKEKKLFAARDRFGVKPFYYTQQHNELYFGSEIKALKAVLPDWGFNPKVLASYFAYGSYGLPDETFFKNIQQLPGGHCLEYSREQLTVKRWYDFENRVSNSPISITESEAKEHYKTLLLNSISLRFRADVPVGINISGGVDSSLLLAMVNLRKDAHKNRAYTFYTGDERYDELPWVEAMVRHTQTPLSKVKLSPNEVEALTLQMSYFQDEPFGGIPTLAYGKLFSQAKQDGIKVLLDGQGMDEAWAGYDYYHTNTEQTIQGIEKNSSPFKANCLHPDFLNLAEKPNYPAPFKNDLLNKQYRDLFYTKIPRALRFNDRLSMASSVELREPFLDYSLVEFAFSLPLDLKFRNGQTKFLLRELLGELLTNQVVFAPKRPLQTPQREWLGNELTLMVDQSIHHLKSQGSKYFLPDALDLEWKKYKNGQQQSAFHLWQWVNFSFLAKQFTN